MEILIWIASTLAQAVLIALALRWLALARRSLRKWRKDLESTR